MRKLLAFVALGATLHGGNARGQDSAALCAQQPRLIGCLPTTPSVARGNVLPLSVGNSTMGVTVGQLLSALTAADVAAVGPLDAATVLARGGAIPRTLADHQVLTVQDLAPVAPNTGADQAANLQAAQNMRQNAGGGMLRVGLGTYLLNSNVYTAGANTWLFERGAQLAGAGQLDAVVDRTVLNASGQGLARLLSSNANEHGLTVQLRAAPTTGSTGYEKTGVIASTIQNDPSSYSGAGMLRDLVGFESQGQIAPGVLTGRIFGYSAGVGPAAGADGYAVGGEFSVQSYSGSDAGPFGSPTSKIAVHAVALGSSNVTAAFATGNVGAQFLDAYTANTAAVVPGGHALSVRPFSTPTAPKTRADDIAFVGMDGSAYFQRVTVPLFTPANSSSPCAPGQLADDASFHYVCVAANTWKRVALSAF